MKLQIWNGQRERGMVPIRPTTGDAAELVQWLAGQIAHGIGIALWSG